MKINKVFTCVLLAAFGIFLSGDKNSAARQMPFKRVRFQITTVAETGEARKILSQTTIEGAPGTDFNIDLNTGNFKMQTKFLTDLIAPDKLKLRAALNTRRFYGNSPANLPLYEEDSQNQLFEINFDEMLILLPFGRGAGDETLKIEITPTLLQVSAADAKAPITIDFDKQIPSGEINVAAVKIPHRFIVEAVLLSNNRRVAAGSREFLLEETGEIILEPESDGKSEIGDQSFNLKIKIDKYIRSRPKDLVGINFSLDEKNAATGGERTPIVSGAGAINIVGEEFSYRLENGEPLRNRNYEIKFKIRPAPGEQTE